MPLPPSPADAAHPGDDPARPVPYAELLSVWFRIGLLSFGGPAGQIALMHREIVDRRHWLSEAQYLNAVSFCMLLPGPEATQIATYAGWRSRGWAGGLIAGGLFVLPGAAIILALAALYAALGSVPWFQAVFLGVKAAVVVVVVEALLRVARRALGSADRWLVAALAFVAIYFLAVPYPLIVLAAALYGFAVYDRQAGPGGGPVAGVPLWRTLGTVLLWGGIWAAPLVLLALWDPDGLLLQIGLFFSRLAVVTFGGAYAVLTYMAQDVVGIRGWLDAAEMLDGLGLAETTPGPLILVTEFVGYLAAAKTGGPGPALAAAALTLWVTFVPCFLWIFTGAPYIQWITAQPRLKGALTGIMAAVVGVVGNLSLWFALHVFFADVGRAEVGPLRFAWPDPASLQPAPLLLAVLAGWLLLVRRWPLIPVLATTTAAGLAWSFATGRI
ncbi:chromate transporter [Brevirhabdus pacifica]|uniref:chromate efflux transporter n=1 Tax=Brevirhabdus pacifica TaxID=1267768 RepID=UPI0009F90D4B|nr:chromate efflux transporter [Brevirhabdus pacifica]PJJ86455.1 chromate transporter [Brevirhabdus pacifica]